MKIEQSIFCAQTFVGQVEKSNKATNAGVIAMNLLPKLIKLIIFMAWTA